jgi:uncharacterized protein (TIGR02147 family)
MINQLPDIFQYIDFRKYLEDYYIKSKTFNSRFTHAYICKRLGQKNANTYFNNVVKGRIGITDTFIDRFIDLLELKPDEAKFFRALVNYNQTKSPNEKEFYFDQLVRLNKTPHQVIDKNAYAYFKTWHHSAVRALLDIIDFKDDYKLLTDRLFPRISLKDARESIALLKKNGLIKQNENGFWKPSEKVIVTGDFIKDAVLKHYQMNYLELAKCALADDTVKLNRNIAMTISLSDKAYDRISDRIKQFKMEIRSLIHKDLLPSSRIYHLNLNFFPLSTTE